MEIYKDLSNPVSQEFEKLLSSQLSKTQIEEGKIIEGKINKITDKFVFLYVEGLKSEPILDINELKSMGHKNISYINDLSNLNAILDELNLNNHMVITMGAGDIWRYNEKYNAHLNEKINQYNDW